MMNKKRVIFTVITAIIGICSINLLSNKVFAGDGTGGDGDACTSNCAGHYYHVYHDCDDKPDLCGSSWHIFRTYDPSAVWAGYQLYNTKSWSRLASPQYCKDIDDQANSKACSRINAFSEGGYDQALAINCPMSQYDYYLALVFDGWKGSEQDKPRYWGPLAAGATYTSVHGNQIHFHRSDTTNTYNALDTNAVEAGAANLTIASGARVTDAVAKHFCKKLNTGICASYSGGTLPGSVGYICVKNNEWQAQSILTGSATAVAGYSKAAVSQTGFASNCDPTSGCNVTFAHNIIRTSGDGVTAYTVSRTSNLTKSDDSVRGVDNNSAVATGYSNADGTAKRVSTNSFTLYPGMIVCERITYVSIEGRSPVYSEVCASALGKAQPGDPPSDTPENPDTPSGDSSFINIKVRNKSVARYNNYTRSVYAKPTDRIKYRVVYNPKLQYTYRLKTTAGRMQMKIDGAGPYNGNSTALGTLFNVYKSPGWNNDYAVSNNFATSDRALQHSVNNTPGDISSKSEEIPGSGDTDYVVTSSNVGHSLDETATLNNGVVQTRNGGTNDNKTTPSQVEFTASGTTVSVANVTTSPAPSKTASAVVPYNYNNTAEITNTNKFVYAGDNFTVFHNYNINPKTNNLTSPGKPYITSVGDPRWKIRLRIEGGDSWWSSIHSGKDDSNFVVADSEMYSTKVVSEQNVINVPDIAAGKRICVQTAVYPINSGAEYNINANNYDINSPSSWSYSPEVCFTVAKKPSLQVWGGNIFSRGKITTANSTKRSLAGYSAYEYKIEGDHGIHFFGSFGELGLIASGQVLGLSSAASTGYGNNNSGTLSPNPLDGFYNNSSNTPNPGGSSTSSLCRLSQLSFSNTMCGDTMKGVGLLGKSSSTTTLENDKTNILGKFIKELDSPNTGTYVVLNDRNKAQADGTYYYYNNADLEVGNSAAEVSVASSTIQMVHSDNTVYVRGNIVYGDTYKKYSELPKLVLYGKNVVIDCNVTRIDALIIADEKVVTCNNFSNPSGGNNVNDGNLAKYARNHINEAANSQQLKINGAVVTKTLIANRTYGAATGANSIVPAEIINFDPTLYMWGGLGNEEGSDGDLEVTMMKEMAPRK